jgi:hypothetical protein
MITTRLTCPGCGLAIPASFRLRLVARSVPVTHRRPCRHRACYESEEGPGARSADHPSRGAARQWGRVSRSQLEAVVLGNATITEWLEDGYLHRQWPAVMLAPAE